MKTQLVQMLRVMKAASVKAPLGKVVLLFGCAVMAFTHPSQAASGDLDLTFGGAGMVTTDFDFERYSTDQARSIVIQSDGKIVVAGESYNDFALARYNVNGSLDTTFNGTGKVTTGFGGREDRGQSVALQADGKIVVAGYSYTGATDATIVFALARYNANGTLDTSFGGTGKVTTDIGENYDVAQGMAVQSDGKIVVAGYSYNAPSADFTIVRYNANGSLDTSFGGTGKMTIAIGGQNASGYAVAIQHDGKILVAGSAYNVNGNSDFALVRCNTNGTLDTSFGGTGKVTTDIGGNWDIAYSVAIQSDRKIVIAGYSSGALGGDFAAVRYNPDGSLDTSFNGSGKATTAIGTGNDVGQSMAIQSDGKIIVAGESYNGSISTYTIALVRYHTNGTLDSAFGSAGKVTTAIAGNPNDGLKHSVAIQGNGKIVVAGSRYNGTDYDFVLVRYEGDYPDTDGDGIPDPYETGTGIYVSPTDTGTDPNKPDSDGDGLTDGHEVNIYHSNPNIADTDGDGFEDGFEVATGFSPTAATSTPDALSSIRTAVEYRFNAAIGVSYRIEASTNLENWQTIETNIIGTGGVVTRFYSIEAQVTRYFRSRRN